MFRIVVATFDEDLAERFSGAMEGLATVARSDPSVGALREIVASIGADLVVVDADAGHGMGNDLVERLRFLREMHPGLSVVAVGDESAVQTVLMAVRAGASDFLDRDNSREAFRAQLSDHLKRRGQVERPESGPLTVVVSGRPNEGEGLFAVNLGALISRRRAANGDVLLIDLSLPTTEADLAMDLKVSYTVRDALYDLPRLDRTLLASTVARHEASGLYVLPLALGSEEAQDLSTGNILSLIFVLRGFFSETIVNIGGFRQAGFLAQLAGPAKAIHLVTTQSFASVKACSELLSRAAFDERTRDRLSLVIADYQSDITLNEEQISQALGISRVHRLPNARAMLVNSLNTGRVVSLEAPNSPYAQAVSGVLEPQNGRRRGIRESAGGVRGLLGRLVPGAS